MALQGLLLLFHLMTRVCGPPMRRSAPRERLKRRRRGRGSWRGGVGVEWTAPRLRDGSCRCACGRPAVAIRPGGQAVARPSRSHSNRVALSQSRAEGSSNNESANGNDRRQFTTGLPVQSELASWRRPTRNQPFRPQPDDSSQHVRVRLSLSGLDVVVAVIVPPTSVRTLAGRHDHRRYVSVLRRERGEKGKAD
jgi:hypothetical protein